MPLPSGTKLGPYQIEGLLGAGGMGEVYRAHDSRVGRDVAVKIVPPTVAADATALSRFEREARAVAMLSHPNIVALYEFGASGGMTYAVMELLEGESLRSRLGSGPLPLRKAIETAAQIARGLAAAHDKHIAHRDLKPENVFIATDGSVKILDFGLARQTSEPDSDAATMARVTEPGILLGTVGYMAPEQVRGERSDHRADIFALGCILHEMLTGRRAFERGTAAETMTAILREEPSPPVSAVASVPPGVERILSRCLEKRPEERFQSARDLTFALESSLDVRSGSDVGTVRPARIPRRWLTGAALLALGLASGAAIGAFAVRRLQPVVADSAAPQFRQLTFDRGTIRDARFAPDGRSIVYSAAWSGAPLRVFMTRTDSSESVRLSLPDARLLSISRSSEIAISLGHRFDGWIGAGTLARTSVLGSAPRVVAEEVREAEWTPDGSDLAIVRRSGTLECLEFPIGNVLYRSSGYISDIRFSADGSRIAFADHPLFADDAGFVSLVDRAGRRTVLTDAHTTVRGLAWSTDASEVWYSGIKKGQSGIFAVTTAGRQRPVWTSPSFVKVYDIAPDGSVLLGRETPDRRIEALFAGASAAVDVTLRSSSTSQWISADGTSVGITDQATPTYSSYLRKTGAEPVLLGEGQPTGVSRDGRWLLALPVSGNPLLLHPTGAGQTRKLPNPDNLVFDSAAWLPDSRHVVMFGQTQGGMSRGYVQSIDSGPPRPFTPEGVRSARWWVLPVSPDGTRVVAVGSDGKQAVMRVSDGESAPIPGLQDGELIVQWFGDGRSVLAARGNGQPWQVDRLDLATGQRTRALEVRVPDGAGLRLSVLAIAQDARHYVHSYSRLLSDLFLVHGLR
jgi:Tol biopolymer transport system component